MEAPAVANPARRFFEKIIHVLARLRLQPGSLFNPVGDLDRHAQAHLCVQLKPPAQVGLDQNKLIRRPLRQGRSNRPAGSGRCVPGGLDFVDGFS